MFGLYSNAIFKIIVKGTDNNIPIGPNTQPQNTKEINTTKGERPKPFPKNRGSSNPPNPRFTIKNPSTTNKALKTPNTISANITAGIAASIDQTFGTKLSIKAIIPHNIGKSISKIYSQININRPVVNEVIVFIIKYLLKPSKKDLIDLNNSFEFGNAFLILDGKLLASINKNKAVKIIKNIFVSILLNPDIVLPIICIAVPGSKYSFIVDSGI